MFDVITFGSATRDILVRPKNLTILKYDPPSREATAGQSKDFTEGKGMCFPLGSKIDIDYIQFTTGGGGTNPAATFALQGFKTAFCGMVGRDLEGRELTAELKKFRINTSLVQVTDKINTNHSVIISNKEDGKRTILSFRGASEAMEERDLPWNKLSAKWFYLAPVSFSLCDKIVRFAKSKNIKVALNPGMGQLGHNDINKILQLVDVVILNQEEASFLTKIPYKNEKDVFAKLDEICPGIAVMTKGENGVTASDGKNIYSAKVTSNVKVIDATGAGDAFGAGFICDYIRSNGDIEKAIQFGMANSQACISQIGAKNGLLKKGQSFDKVAVTKEVI